ncbi:hypothetical protein GGQ85_003773 [Nitrobacter vulgaris]|jgi:hypothetical protein|uniref:hypothetical protein n=1 Tax=Nitrobacter vulgaris TaxID=29421 RepID=UPI0028609B92|nr:hypothetical protein [Nitrobacter vulgaris]MDR6306045.1 hypothetical protein [Nitrobacter vulgaris]
MGDDLLSGVEANHAEASRDQVPPADPQIETVEPRKTSIWVKELPYSLILVLTLIGVAYTSFSNQPIVIYWEFLALLIGVMCIATGWQNTNDKETRLRLISTQVLHWSAFLLVMNMILLPSAQRILNASVTGIAIFTLLALGTVTAGIHVASWQICLLGLVMALSVPVIAWIKASALLVVLILSVALGVGVVLWWPWRKKESAPD